MMLLKTDSIRDVIAFPKTQSASCLMTDAPSNVSNEQLSELGIKTIKNPNERVFTISSKSKRSLADNDASLLRIIM